jgi:hypothetical protein
MPRNLRTSKRHERLQQIGITQRIARPGKAKAVWITYHLCEICETQWRHVDDPEDPCVGWSVEKEAEVCV